MTPERLAIQVTGEDEVAAVENALEAAAREHDSELNTTPGRGGKDELTKGEALVEVSRAYTGWPARTSGDDD